jgi:bacillithiol biosynthesis deacetylase BshB1
MTPTDVTAADPPLDLLAFGAHPDDVELCCGGLLAASAARGYRTGIVDLTRGELGSSGTPELRASEAARAAEILGLAVRENLGLPDGWIDPGAGHDLDPAARAAQAPLARVVAVIRRLRPAMVLYPWTHERHPDHEAASALVGRALFYAGVKKFPGGPAAPALPAHHVREALQYPMRYELPPSFIVDISAVVERKAAAIAAYASQLRPTTPTLIGSPLTVAAFEARDRYFGSMIGVAAGEAYLRRAPMGLLDPVAHFRDSGFPGALFYGPPR